MKALVALLALTVACGLINPKTVQDVEIGLAAAQCFLEHYAGYRNKGTPEADAIALSALECGVTAIQGAGLLSSHRKAEVLEGFVLPPAADGGGK